VGSTFLEAEIASEWAKCDWKVTWWEERLQETGYMTRAIEEGLIWKASPELLRLQENLASNEATIAEFVRVKRLWQEALMNIVYAVSSSTEDEE
jgi:hypothetical protein